MENYFTNLFNMLGGQQQIPTIRPEVLKQAQRQMIQPQTSTQPGMFFGVGPAFSGQVDPLTQTMQSAISSQYNLGTGQVRAPEGVYMGDGVVPKEPGMFDALSDMSGQETMALISGIQGLLAEPEAPQLASLRIPSATAGLRLGETDLSKYYQGLLR